MPFMIGRAPIRRTLQYLEAGKLVLKDSIQIFSVNYNTHGKHHAGTRELIFWCLPQIQYKNPNVQVVTFRNMTPTPFIKCYFDNKKSMLIDTDNKSRNEIMDHLVKVIGKTKQELMQESALKMKKDNPANFGVGCMRSCICVVPGQLPCPGTVPLPFHMRGKHIQLKDDE